MSDWTLVIIAAVIVGYAALTRRLATTPITAAIVFVAAGLLFGHVGLDWLKLSFNDRSITVLATSTLVVVLFSDASRVDLHALRREYALPARLLGIGLPLTIVAGTVIGALLIPGITWPEAAVLAIVLAPTDAALGQAVVTNPDLPSRIRSALNVESGLNDGICVPLLTIMLAVAAADSGQESNLHAARLVAEAIGWGAFGGLVAGIAGAGLLRFARRRDLIAEAWIPIVPLMTAIASFAIADALGGSGFIAAFVAGVVYGRIAPRDPEATLLSEQIGNVLNAGTFIVFGAAILGVLWDKIGAIDIVYAVFSLTIVRMLPVAIAMIGTQARLRTIAFVGWFGPRGLASIVFGVVVVDAAGLPHTSTLTLAIVATVALSVLAHGLTAQPLAARYAAWCTAAVSRGRAPMESVPTPSQRWRADSSKRRADPSIREADS